MNIEHFRPDATEVKTAEVAVSSGEEPLIDRCLVASEADNTACRQHLFARAIRPFPQGPVVSALKRQFRERVVAQSLLECHPVQMPATGQEHIVARVMLDLSAEHRLEVIAQHGQQVGRGGHVGIGNLDVLDPDAQATPHGVAELVAE